MTALDLATALNVAPERVRANSHSGWFFVSVGDQREIAATFDGVEQVREKLHQQEISNAE